MRAADRLRARPGTSRRRALTALAVAVLATLVAVLVAVRGGPEDDRGSRVSLPAAEVPPAPVAGEEYVVSPSGDDEDDGSAGSPWQTLGHALAQLRPGDRLTVRDGEYEEDVDLEVREGTRSEPIQVTAAEGARPVLRGLLWLEDLSWWDIRGIDVTWDDGNDSDQHMVKLVDGVGWRFADAELWGAKSFAALLVGGEPEDYTLSGLYVHDTHPANDTNQDHLVYLNSGRGGGVLERSILAHSRNGRAVKIGPPDEGDGEVRDITIRYVTMVDNRGPSNVQLAYDVSGVVIEHCLLVGSAEGRASVTVHDFSGEDNVVRDSLSWESSALLDDEDGLEDGGGNVRIDPRLTGADGDRPYSPQEPEAQSYGRWAVEG